MNNYCRNCGKELESDTSFCPKCGMQINQEQAASFNQQPIYVQQQNANVQNTKPDGLSTAGFIMGIISLFINIYGLIGLLALILSCVGLAQTPITDRKGRSRAIRGIIIGIISVLWGIYQIYKLYSYFN